MKITLFSNIEVTAPSVELQNKAYSFWSFENPQYTAAIKYGKYMTAKSIPSIINLAHYSDEEDVLYLPRGSEILLPIDLTDCTDARVFAPVKFPMPKAKLTTEQQKAFNAIKQSHANHDAGVFLCELTTGLGKTFLMLYTSATLFRQRTLILCPTLSIMEAWFSDIERFFGIKRRNIGRIQAGCANLSAPFIVASTASVRNLTKEALQQLHDTVGTLVIDEAHKLGNNTLYEIASAFPCAYKMGMTATAQGGRTYNRHIEALLGKPLISLKITDKDTATTMYVRKINIVRTMFSYAQVTQYLNYHELIDNMTTDDERNELIVKSVLTDYKSNNTVLVLTRRIEHARLLQFMLQERVANVNLLCGETNTDKIYTKALYGAINQRATRIIVAVDSAISIGTNLPTLDSLHLTLPYANRSSIEQAVGRVRRAEGNKTECKVTYYLDQRLPYCLYTYKRFFKALMEDLGVSAQYTFIGKNVSPVERRAQDIAKFKAFNKRRQIRQLFSDQRQKEARYLRHMKYKNYQYY